MPDDEKAITIPNLGRAEAVRRIRECEKTGQTWLDLGHLALEELPPELGQLTHLRHLALRKERCDLAIEDRIKWIYDKNRPTQALTDLSSLVKLSALTTLSLSGCESVSDLGPLQTLTGLNTLYLSWCKSVSDLGPLRTLTGLNTLHLAWCESVSDLAPLRTLTRLTNLNLYGCMLVSDLEPLRPLTELSWLILDFCKPLSD